MNNTKTYHRVIFYTALALIATILIGSIYMVEYALTPEVYDEKTELEQHFKEYPWQKEWTDSIITNGLLRDTFLLNENEQKMHAIYLPAPTPTTRTAVLVHGYKDCAMRMLRYAYFYNKDFNYNILIPDLHAHGKSEGSAIQMGWLDRLDVMRWIEVANTMFKSQNNIVVHGLSMGAATTMMLSGEEAVQSQVRCFIEDCGYTSVWDEFKSELWNQFSLPAFPILYTASWVCELRDGWNFKEASALDQVRKCTRPMLFIHGDDDDFVPTDMVIPLYEAHHGPKQIWITKGVAHAESYADYPEEYTDTIKQYLNKYMK